MDHRGARIGSTESSVEATWRSPEGRWQWSGPAGGSGDEGIDEFETSLEHKGDSLTMDGFMRVVGVGQLSKEN